jgi:hypothetical protein
MSLSGKLDGCHRTSYQIAAYATLELAGIPKSIQCLLNGQVILKRTRVIKRSKRTDSLLSIGVQQETSPNATDPSNPPPTHSYLFVQYPPPNCGLTKQPPHSDGHPVAIPQDLVPQLARSMIGSASRIAFWSFVSHLQGTEVGCAELKLDTLTLSGKAIGPAIAKAANSIVVSMVSCMVTIVGLWVGQAKRVWFGGLFESCDELGFEIDHHSIEQGRSFYVSFVV